jgi:hypothetical protein
MEKPLRLRRHRCFLRKERCPGANVANKCQRRIEISTGEVTQYTWDIKNRQVGVTYYDSVADADLEQNATKIVGYTRDMYNRLIGKTVDSDGDGTIDETNRYVYDRDQIIMEFTDGEVSGNYLWGRRSIN